MQCEEYLRLSRGETTAEPQRRLAGIGPKGRKPEQPRAGSRLSLLQIPTFLQPCLSPSLAVLRMRDRGTKLCSTHPSFRQSTLTASQAKRAFEGLYGILSGQAPLTLCQASHVAQLVSLRSTTESKEIRKACGQIRAQQTSSVGAPAKGTESSRKLTWQEDAAAPACAVNVMSSGRSKDAAPWTSLRMLATARHGLVAHCLVECQGHARYRC